MGPVISPESRTRIDRPHRSRHRGRRHVTWSTAAQPTIPKRIRQFPHPTVLEGLPFSSEMARTEIFGPVLSMHPRRHDIDAAHHDLVNTGVYGNQALPVHLERRDRARVPLRSRGRQCRHQRRRRRAHGLLPVQRRARQLLRRPAWTGPRRLRVLHAGKSRRRTRGISRSTGQINTSTLNQLAPACANPHVRQKRVVRLQPGGCRQHDVRACAKQFSRRARCEHGP